MESAILKLGDVAPQFALGAANSDEIISLNRVLRDGPAILEFLRGTW
jgi:peroxiredoxin